MLIVECWRLPSSFSATLAKSKCNNALTFNCIFFPFKIQELSCNFCHILSPASIKEFKFTYLNIFFLCHTSSDSVSEVSVLPLCCAIDQIVFKNILFRCISISLITFMILYWTVIFISCMTHFYFFTNVNKS